MGHGEGRNAVFPERRTRRATARQQSGRTGHRRPDIRTLPRLVLAFTGRRATEVADDHREEPGSTAGGQKKGTPSQLRPVKRWLAAGCRSNASTPVGAGSESRYWASKNGSIPSAPYSSKSTSIDVPSSCVRQQPHPWKKYDHSGSVGTTPYCGTASGWPKAPSDARSRALPERCCSTTPATQRCRST